MSRCIGYYPYDNRLQDPAQHCPNEADTPAGLWCQRCEDLRRRAITAQLAAVTQGFSRGEESDG